MPAPLPAPDFDPASAYPAIGAARRTLAARDWPAFLAGYELLDWAGRGLVVHSLDPDEALATYLSTLVERDPDDVVAASTYAAVLVALGWRIRSRYFAVYVSDEQWAGFRAYLNRAERLLIDTTARAPEAVLAWAERLNTARGLGLGRNEARRRYDRVVRHDPHNLYAQRRLLQQLCPKWGGSFEAVHPFAFDAMMAAPLGAPNGVLVADGHLEHWFALSGADARAYAREAAVHEDLDEAALRSVFHPNFGQGADRVAVLNAFAMAFAVFDDDPSARRCFEALGPHATELPWAGIPGDPAVTFRTYRDRAFTPAARGIVR